MEQWRVTLAFILSMAVLLAYSFWFTPQPATTPAVTQSAPVESGTNVAPSAAQPAQSAASAPAPAPAQHEIPAKEITLENKAVRATLSTRGGVLTHWVLKDFREGASEDTPFIDLLDRQGGEAFRLSLLSDHAANLPFEVIEEKKDEKQWSITLAARDGDVEIRKQFIIHEDTPHLMDVGISLVNRGGVPLTLEPRLWIQRDQKHLQERSGFLSFLGGGQQDYFYPVHLTGNELFHENDWKKMNEGNEKSGPIRWSALNDRYFLLSVISRQDSERNGVRYGKLAGNKLYTSLSYGPVTLNPGMQTQQIYSAYLGPKKRDLLKALGVGLEKSVDYGWLSFVAIPLLWLLIFFEQIIPNWGIAIILLTFFVKLLLHPVNKKSLESMKEMQKMQPKLQALREKFKNDREKLNMEMMQLFRVHKVNPLGGCLPMLLQIPVYFALYKVLWNAIELYHAPFFGFYRDLSAPDPYFIAPVVLGVLMYFQQKYTPQAATTDPAQQKIMLVVMPIMFAAFMLFLPFGLVLYILVNTLMSFLQQYMMFKEISLWPKKARP